MRARVAPAPARAPRSRATRARCRGVARCAAGETRRALEAAREGMTIALALRDEAAVVVEKADASAATTGDVAAQTAVLMRLRTLGSMDDFVGEETVEGLDAAAAAAAAARAAGGTAAEAARETRAPSERYWCCDPLDGTKAYMSKDGEKQFVLGLALVDARGTATTAVMMAPNWPGGGVEMYAARGEGCFVRKFGSSEPFRRTTCARATTLSEARVVISAHENFESLPLGKAMGAAPAAVKRLCCGSLCKYVSCALGESSVFIQHPSGDGFVNSWDHAAGILCCEEAGCAVSDLFGGAITLLGRDGDRRRFAPGGGGIICATREIHADVVRAFAVGSKA